MTEERPSEEQRATDAQTLRALRRRLRGLSQQELDEYLDAEVRAGRGTGPAWDVAYRVWEITNDQ